MTPLYLYKDIMLFVILEEGFSTLSRIYTWVNANLVLTTVSDLMVE